MNRCVGLAGTLLMLLAASPGSADDRPPFQDLAAGKTVTIVVPTKSPSGPVISLPGYSGLHPVTLPPADPPPAFLSRLVQRLQRIAHFVTPETHLKMGDTIIRVQLNGAAILLSAPLGSPGLPRPATAVAPLPAAAPQSVPARPARVPTEPEPTAPNR